VPNSQPPRTPPSSSSTRRAARPQRLRREKVPASRYALVSLYSLVSAMNRASDLTEVYEAALDSLTAVLGAERAAILLFDPDGVMRFKAWRGLSDEYRRAVEGHSPWTADAREAKPIAVADVTAEPSLAALRATVLSEGIRALAFIPLCFAGRLLGKFMIYHGAPHRFEAEEVQLAEIIAGHVASAVVRERDEEALREADRRKDEFLATLSHELRNPLAPIRNAVELISHPQADPATTERARGVLERQLRQLVRLVDDLLDVSRITRGKMELRREPVEIHAAVASALETVQPLVDSASLALTFAPASGPAVVSGDFVRLAQVFTNLLNNAARYTDPGGRIEIRVATEGGRAVVRVRDTGIGFPPEASERIFHPFQRGPERSAARGGLGIGLSLVRGLVELHGGGVEAHSEGPGRGSEFVVRLPLLAAEAPRPVAATRPQVEAGRSRRVLVADDNPDSAESLAMLLRCRGHEVDVVGDGQAAVEAVRALAPEIALLDIGMPRLDGYEAAARIRSAPWGERTVLVALTGFGQERDQRRAHEAGFDVHLTKPVDPDTLAELVSQAPAGRAGC
jgi:signal transduction histidine kinase/ActR/RegA family two-component response regulator